MSDKTEIISMTKEEFAKCTSTMVHTVNAISKSTGIYPKIAHLYEATLSALDEDVPEEPDGFVLNLAKDYDKILASE